MQIDTTRLFRSPVGSRRSYQIDETIGKENIGCVKGQLTLSRTGRGIMVQGMTTAQITNTCSRCLKPVNYTVEFDIEEEFILHAVVTDGIPSAEDFDTSTIINDNNILDLSEVVRQYALLAMPAKPLCMPNCTGLCPTCGHDLNESPCECSSHTHSEFPVKVKVNTP